MIIAMLSWATYSALLKKKKYELSQISLLQVVISFGVIFLIPLYFIDMNMGNSIKLEKPFFLILTYVVLFPGLASFFFLDQRCSFDRCNSLGSIFTFNANFWRSNGYDNFWWKIYVLSFVRSIVYFNGHSLIK